MEVLLGEGGFTWIGFSFICMIYIILFLIEDAVIHATNQGAKLAVRNKEGKSWMTGILKILWDCLKCILFFSQIGWLHLKVSSSVLASSWTLKSKEFVLLAH